MHTLYHSEVLHGDKQGRKISFPTINLDPQVWPQNQEPGVNASEVTIDTHTFQAALYFGPRTMKEETFIVLEIFLLDFSEEIYGQTVSFSLRKYIRTVVHFNSFEELKEQIAKDVQDVKAAFENKGAEMPQAPSILQPTTENPE